MNSVINLILWGVYLFSLYFAVFWLLVFLQKGVSSEQKKLKGNPFVTIVIPAWNEEKNLRKTVDSAMSLDYPKDKMEIIIVNDGSTDGTGKIANLLSKNRLIKIIHNNSNKGKGNALNSALNIAGGEFFVCLDADSYPEKQALQKMLPHFEDRSVACVLPSMKVHSPSNFWQRVQWSEYIVNMFYKKLMMQKDCIHVAPGPFSVYRTSVIKKLGGFDEKNLTEDLEITYNLQKNHYKIIQLLNTVVETKAPKTFSQLYRQRNRWFKGAFINTIKYRSMMFKKDYGDFGMIQLPTIMLSGFLSIILLLTAVYYAFPKLEVFKNLKLINFDLWTIIKNFSINFHIFDLNYPLIVTSIVMLAFSLLVVFYANKHSNERVLKFGILPVFFFFVYYYLVMGISWLGVAFDLIRGKVQKW